MPQTTFVLFFPTSAVLLPQEPKTAPDSPAPAPTPGSPQGPGTTQTPAGPQGSQGSPQSCAGGSEMLWYLPLFLALMYFMVMRPEQKRRKQQQALMSSMKVGDRVVTAGGMHGVVSKLADKTVTVRVDNTQMTFDRVAIARIERDDAPAAQPPKS